MLSFRFHLWIHLFKEDGDRTNFYINNQFFFFVAIVFLSAVFAFYFKTPDYYKMLHKYLEVLGLLLITFWGIRSVQRDNLNIILHRYYFLVFFTGLVFIVLTVKGIIRQNEILNENTVGLFLAPFFIYLLITSKGRVQRAIIYLIGSLMLFISEAIASFVSFVLLPVFFLIVMRLKSVRFVYSIYILLGILFTITISLIDSEYLTSLLSNRNLLWNAYMTEATSSLRNIVAGSANWKAEIDIPLLGGLHAHNAYINLFYYSGIFGLFLYISLIVFSIRRRVNRVTVSDGLLFFMITFQFAESAVPLFHLAFPSLIFYLNLFINKESENLPDNYRALMSEYKSPVVNLDSRRGTVKSRAYRRGI